MSVWFAVAWLLAMVLLAAWVARSVGTGTTHRQRVAEDDRRRTRPTNPKHRELTRKRGPHAAAAPK